jgi:hypothetical protein
MATPRALPSNSREAIKANKRALKALGIMWIMTPTTRGAEQEVKVSPSMPPSSTHHAVLRDQQ